MQRQHLVFRKFCLNTRLCCIVSAKKKTKKPALRSDIIGDKQATSQNMSRNIQPDKCSATIEISSDCRTLCSKIDPCLQVRPTVFPIAVKFFYHVFVVAIQAKYRTCSCGFIIYPRQHILILMSRKKALYPLPAHMANTR